MYMLQFPIFGGIANYLYDFKPQQHYLLNKFSVAGFGFYDGPELIKLMKLGDELSMIPNPDNLYDEYAVELHWKDNLLGHIPRSDNRHIFRLLEQGMDLVCTIRQLNHDEDTWQMCKVKVELVV